jgi:hypothetical protein
MKKDKKTVGVVIRFFTNNLPEGVGANMDQTPCWSCGNVRLEANGIKGIRSNNVMFNYMDDLPRAIRAVLGKGKISVIEDVAYAERAKRRNGLV